MPGEFIGPCPEFSEERLYGKAQLNQAKLRREMLLRNTHLNSEELKPYLKMERRSITKLARDLGVRLPKVPPKQASHRARKKERSEKASNRAFTALISARRGQDWGKIIQENGMINDWTLGHRHGREL